MEIGFIGTYRDMTDKQLTFIRQILQYNFIKKVHHGDGVGCDEIFHCAAREFKKFVIIHPSTSSSMRAFGDYDEIYAPQYYQRRDLQIIRACEAMIFAPMTEDGFSKIWRLIRLSEKLNKVHLIVFPSGKIKYKGHKLNVSA